MSSEPSPPGKEERKGGVRKQAVFGKSSNGRRKEEEEEEGKREWGLGLGERERREWLSFVSTASLFPCPSPPPPPRREKKRPLLLVGVSVGEEEGWEGGRWPPPPTDGGGRGDGHGHPSIPRRSIAAPSPLLGLSLPTHTSLSSLPPPVGSSREGGREV